MKELETFNNCYLHYVNNSSQSKSQQQKTHIFSLVDAVTDSTKDIQIHDEVVSKLLYLYPDDVNLYFKMGYIYKTANNTEKAISWHKMGYQINPRDARNTAELCELLLIKKRISAVFDLDKNNLFESFHADKKFLAVYARCHLEKLNFHRALFYLLKLIEMTAPIKSVSHSDKHLKWLNYHDAAYAYFSTGLIDKAVSYNAKALDLAQKFILSIEDKMLSFSNLLFYNVYTYFDSDKYFQLCKGINMFYPNKTPFTARVGSWSSKDSKDSKDSTRKFKYNRNIFPDSLERSLFSRMDPIVKTLKAQANSVCRNHINNDYIKKAFNNFNYGFCYKDADTNSIVGFCIWQEYRETVMVADTDFRHISVLLICALPTDYKLGKIMLFDIETYVLRRKFNRIQLQPLNEEIIPWYESNGYKLRYHNNAPLLDKDINVFFVKSKEGTIRRKTLKQQLVRVGS